MSWGDQITKVEKLENESEQCMGRVKGSGRKEIWRKPLIQSPRARGGILCSVHGY